MLAIRNPICENIRNNAGDLTEWSEDFGRDSEGTGDSGTDSY